MSTEFDKSGKYAINFILSLIGIKLLYAIYMGVENGFDTFSTIVLGAFIALIILFFLLALINASRSDQSGGGGMDSAVYLENDVFNKLRIKYEDMANEFIEKKEYKKAAYIHMKILQNPYRAADVLDEGGFYNEAGIVYQKKCFNYHSAAECYVKGRSYKKAIKLYEEIEEWENVGDVYRILKEEKKAREFYQIIVDEHIELDRFVRASMVYKEKMNDSASAQRILLQGWVENKDAENCLHSYFHEYDDPHESLQKIKLIQSLHVHNTNKKKFLNVLKGQYGRFEETKKPIQNIAYEMIAGENNTEIPISFLNHFVSEDSKIKRDTQSYRMGKG